MKRFASTRLGHWQGLLAHTFFGALAGMLLLHPVTKAIYGEEWHGARSELERIALAFTPGMLPMTAAFGLLGGVVGLAFGWYHRLLRKHERAVGFYEAELGRTLSSLIAAGENEHVEFKAAARWDHDKGCVNRGIEQAIARTIAGFLNHAGGSLLIGVTDAATVCGLDHDYATLHDANRDGFERFIIGLVRSHIGGDACPLTHVTFHRAGDQDVCRVIVEPSERPMYLRDGTTALLVVRMGNSTRELDVREAMEYAARRFDGRGLPAVATS